MPVKIPHNRVGYVIDSIQREEVLWDPDHPDYALHAAKDEAWLRISRRLHERYHRAYPSIFIQGQFLYFFLIKNLFPEKSLKSTWDKIKKNMYESTNAPAAILDRALGSSTFNF